MTYRDEGHSGGSWGPLVNPTWLLVSLFCFLSLVWGVGLGFAFFNVTFL